MGEVNSFRRGEGESDKVSAWDRTNVTETKKGLQTERRRRGQWTKPPLERLKESGQTFAIIGGLLALWTTSIGALVFKHNLWAGLNLMADALVTVSSIYALNQFRRRRIRLSMMNSQSEFLRRLTRGHDLQSVLSPLLEAASARYTKSAILVSLLTGSEDINADHRYLQVVRQTGATSEDGSFADHLTDHLTLANGQAPEILCVTRRDCVVIVNSPSDPLWSIYGSLLTAHGYASCWVYPVFDWDNTVIGTLSLYHGDIQIPSSYDMQVLGSFAAAIGLAVDKERIDKQYRQFAYHDPLTGLGNRRQFVESLDEGITSAKADGTNLALLWLDMDKFKEINDSFGHAVGDDVLVEVARRLQDASPESAVLARLGGDEFAILIPDQTEQSATQFGQQLLAAISQPMRINTQVFELKASLGVTLYPELGQDARDLMRRADMAMYQVKASGRGGVRAYDSES
ncbi:GGDEF domain-containing protein [Alicyclobacillus curvatus]|nr:GGDEF domain-containing protein [Alicyclobacillus curvatus]